MIVLEKLARACFFEIALEIMVLHILIFTLLSTSYLNSDTSSKSAKIGALNAETYQKVCRKLNQDLPGKDWKTMTEKMGYNIDDVKSFSRNDNPADAVLVDWGTGDGNDLHKLIEILTDMGRGEVVGIIKEAVGVSTLPNN